MFKYKYTVLKGVIKLKVAYDKKNDIVSVYLEENEASDGEVTKEMEYNADSRKYDVEEAADLILDMVDIVDKKGNFMGFRVFNASKYYDSELLVHADIESLGEDELKKVQKEKIIAVYDSKKNKLVVNNG